MEPGGERDRIQGAEPIDVAVPRFDAQSVERLATVHKSRFEMQFRDSDGKGILLSLPLQVAVDVACTICDVSVHAPYFIGGVRVNRGRALS